MNEERNIGWVLSRLPDIVNEVIVVDAYSTDRTVDVVRAVRPDAVVVPQIGRGKGAALRTAFAAASGEYIVALDSDCSMHPSEIVRFVQTLDRGYDFVHGSRYLPGGGSDDLTWLRSAGNRALTMSVNTLFMVPLTDLCCGFFAFRRRCLSDLALAGCGFEIETEIVLRAIKARLRIAEVPSIEHRRRHGESNLHAVRDGGRVLRKIVRERIARKASIVVDHVQVAEVATSPAFRPAGEADKTVREAIALDVTHSPVDRIPTRQPSTKATALDLKLIHDASTGEPLVILDARGAVNGFGPASKP